MARDNVEDTDDPTSGSPGPAGATSDRPADSITDSADSPGSADSTESADSPDEGAGPQREGADRKRGSDPAAGDAPGGSKRRATSRTATTAAHTRSVMQRRHVRTGLLLTAAVGVEVAGVAGLAVAGLLGWEWGEPLWGHGGGVWVVLQVAVGLVGVAMVLSWLVRPEQLRARLRVPALVPTGAVAVVAVALSAQSEPAARGPGPLVAAVAAVLVLAGSVAWLLGLRNLRRLFPFGLADARTRGFGNLAAVRRAQFAGLPAGAVSGAALVAGALLVTPGWVTTVESETAGPVALPDDPSAPAGEPVWTVELAAADESRQSQVWATPGGVVVEEQSGARAVDPRTGQARWHWRDPAYQRVAGAVTDGGRTLLLGLEYQGESSGRDRVVALDTGTGELRWESFDDGLVAAMATIVVTDEQGDWFVVPDQPPSPAVGAESELALHGHDAADGTRRWELTAAEGCGFTAATGGAEGVLTTIQQCAGEDGAEGEDGAAAAPTNTCLVTAVDPATGDTRWSWPDPDTAATDCQVTATGDLVVVAHQADGEQAALGLDAATGERRWTADPEDGRVGLGNAVLTGDALVGTEWSDDGSGTGAGAGELVIRDAADGAVRERVALPSGQPLEVVPGPPGTAAVAQYRPETGEVMLLSVDLSSAEVTSETTAVTGPEGAAFRRLALSAGPAALTLNALVAEGPDAESAEYSLLVYGW